MWAKLYKLTIVAIIANVLFIPLSIVIFVIWPPFPDDILIVIQENWLAGLMSLDFMYLLSNLPVIPIYLALYVSLREDDPSWSLLAVTMGLLSFIFLVPARPVVEMFALSELAARGADAESVDIAKELLLAQFNGTGYHAHYVFGCLSFFTSSILMLRSSFYPKAAGYVGIATNVIAFGIYAPEVGVYISLLSVLGYLVWWAMLGYTYYRASRK